MAKKAAKGAKRKAGVADARRVGEVTAGIVAPEVRYVWTQEQSRRESMRHVSGGPSMLVIAQRDHGVEVHGPPHGNLAGEQRDQD
jgi:hypothetical protein